MDEWILVLEDEMQWKLEAVEYKLKEPFVFARYVIFQIISWNHDQDRGAIQYFDIARKRPKLEKTGVLFISYLFVTGETIFCRFLLYQKFIWQFVKKYK